MYRTLPSGSLFVPRRGNIPPPCPEGYLRDGGDPWIFHIDLSPCKYRVDKPDKTCNCARVILWCDSSNRKITQLDCKGCTDGLR